MRSIAHVLSTLVVVVAALGQWLPLRSAGSRPVQSSCVHLPVVFGPRATPTATPAYPHAQLIRNGSFEEGFSGWTVLGAAQVSSAEASKGRHSARLCGALVATPDFPRYDGRDALVQVVVVPDWADHAYLQLDWFLTSCQEDEYLEICVYKESGGGYITGRAANTSLPGLWQTMIPLQVSDEAGKTLTLWIQAGGSVAGPNATWYVDDVQLTFVKRGGA